MASSVGTHSSISGALCRQSDGYTAVMQSLPKVMIAGRDCVIVVERDTVAHEEDAEAGALCLKDVSASRLYDEWMPADAKSDSTSELPRCRTDDVHD